MILNPKIFRAYDIRGEAFVDFDEDGFCLTGQAFGQYIAQKFNKKSPKILYGGSVNNLNILQLKKISVIDGFLIGGASKDSKKFIDIIKKTYI